MHLSPWGRYLLGMCLIYVIRWWKATLSLLLLIRLSLKVKRQCLMFVLWLREGSIRCYILTTSRPGLGNLFERLASFWDSKLTRVPLSIKSLLSSYQVPIRKATQAKFSYTKSRRTKIDGYWNCFDLCMFSICIFICQQI